MNKEPSVLDYVKARLMPWKVLHHQIPAAEAGQTSQKRCWTIDQVVIESETGREAPGASIEAVSGPADGPGGRTG
jgi:hypothetical protein